MLIRRFLRIFGYFCVGIFDHSQLTETKTNKHVKNSQKLMKLFHSKWRLFHNLQKFKTWLERIEGYFLDIWCFPLWILYNVELRSMFKQLDPHLTANHREVAKEINVILSFSPKERLRDNWRWKFRRKYQNNFYSSSFAKMNFKIDLCKSVQSYCKFNKMKKIRQIE